MTPLDWSTIQWYNKSLVWKALNHPICEGLPGWHTRHTKREVPCYALQCNFKLIYTVHWMWKMVKIKRDWRIQALCDVTLCCWVNDTPHRLLDPRRWKNCSHLQCQEPHIWQSITSQKPESLATQQWQLEILQVTRRIFRLNSAVQVVRHEKPLCALPIAISADLERYQNYSM